MVNPIDMTDKATETAQTFTRSLAKLGGNLGGYGVQRQLRRELTTVSTQAQKWLGLLGNKRLSQQKALGAQLGELAEVLKTLYGRCQQRQGEEEFASFVKTTTDTLLTKLAYHGLIVYTPDEPRAEVRRGSVESGASSTSQTTISSGPVEREQAAAEAARGEPREKFTSREAARLYLRDKIPSMQKHQAIMEGQLRAGGGKVYEEGSLVAGVNADIADSLAALKYLQEKAGKAGSPLSAGEFAAARANYGAVLNLVGAYFDVEPRGLRELGQLGADYTNKAKGDRATIAAQFNNYFRVYDAIRAQQVQ